MISSSGEKSDGNPSGGSSNLSVSGGNSDGDSSGGSSDLSLSGGNSNGNPSGGRSVFSLSGGNSDGNPSGGQSDCDSVSEDEIQVSKSSRKRKAHSIKAKLEVVDYAEKYSKNAASKKFGIGRTSVRKWVDQEKQLRDVEKNLRRNGWPEQGATLLLLNSTMNWLSGYASKELRRKKVSRRIIQKKAIKMFVCCNGDEKEFRASIGWLQKFMNRHNFRSRLPTTVCQKPPVEYEDALVSFVMYLSQLRERTSYAYIFACDETSVWLDPSGGKCIDNKGAKEISVLTTGHDKLRVTVMLTARSDGFKCLPYVLLDRKRVDKGVVEKFKGKLHLAWEGTTWMNDDIVTDYLKRVLGQFPFGKRLLVWDSFRCHLKTRNKVENVSLKKLLKWCGIDTAVVPGGCTKFIQAPDVCWNAPFKARIRQLYEDWMMHGEKR